MAASSADAVLADWARAADAAAPGLWRGLVEEGYGPSFGDLDEKAELADQRALARPVEAVERGPTIPDVLPGAGQPPEVGLPVVELSCGGLAPERMLAIFGPGWGSQRRGSGTGCSCVRGSGCSSPSASPFSAPGRC